MDVVPLASQQLATSDNSLILSSINCELDDLIVSRRIESPDFGYLLRETSHMPIVRYINALEAVFMVPFRQYILREVEELRVDGHW